MTNIRRIYKFTHSLFYIRIYTNDKAISHRLCKRAAPRYQFKLFLIKFPPLQKRSKKNRLAKPLTRARSGPFYNRGTYLRK